VNPFCRRLVIGLLLFGISSSYLLLSIARGPSAELYALLARSFLQGKTALLTEPRPELLSLPDPYDPEANSKYRLLHDASLYKGRYYLYFGAVPVVTLFLPYRLLTDLDLPNRVAVPIFCIAGYLSSCALFFLLAGHNRWVLPFWLQCAAIVSLGSMSMVCLILRRPSVYEVAIAAGYFFVMAGFLFLARAILVRRTPSKWLVLAGLMFGLAVGCRPHLVVICGIVLGAFAIRARRSPGLVIAMTTGMAVCGIVLGWYNYVRFDNPIEFGRTYQLTSFSANRSSAYYSGLEFNLDAAFRSAEEFLFLTPHVDTNVPFFHTVFINPLPGRRGRPLWMERMVGLIPAAPFALLGSFMPFFLGRRLTANGLDEASAWLLYAMYWSGVVVFFVLCVVGWVLGRYLVDFAPLLTFEGASLTAMLWQTIPEGRSKWMFSWGVGAAAIYGAVLNAALATPRLEMILKFLRK
jgi:hypothetical protein